MTRIKCAKIHYGESFVLPIEKSEDEKKDSPEKIKLKEEIVLLENEIKQAEIKRDEIIADAKKQAEVLIEKSRADMEREHQEVLAKREEEQKQLEAEAMQVKEKAYNTGYEDGYKQGFQVITQELEDKIIAVDTFAKSKFALKANIIKSSELDIINLVLEIAQKICTKSLELNPDLIKIITVNAIKALKDKEEIKIIINPKLTEIINSVSEKLKEEIPQLKTIRIIEENNVSSDGTIVESLLTRVDSRVRAQINEITDKLMESYNSTDYYEFLPVEEHPLIEDFSEIQLSDEANITDFLNELEEIHSIEDKARDEDAEYYEKINLSELKGEKSASVENQKSLEDINLDIFENFEDEDVQKTEDIFEEVEEFLNDVNILDEEAVDSTQDEIEEFDSLTIDIAGGEKAEAEVEDEFKELDLSEIENIMDEEVPDVNMPLEIDISEIENIDLAEEDDVQQR